MNKIPYDITFHPTWWHENAGIDFSQPFFDDYRVRMESDVKMRRTMYEHFGAYGIGEKDPQPRPLLGTDLLAAGYLYSELMGCDIVYQPDNSPQVVCRNLEAEDLDQVEVPDLDSSPVWARTQKQIDALLEKYGFTDNPYEAIAGTSEQAASVYLLDEDPEATLAFLREYYNPDAQMVETGEWNDKIVRQVVTGPQEEPGRQQNQ